MNECPGYAIQILTALLTSGIGLVAGLAVAYVSHWLSLDRERLSRRDDSIHRFLTEIERQRFLLNGEYRFPDLRELDFYRQSKRPLADAVYGYIARAGKDGGSGVRKAWEQYCCVDESSLDPDPRNRAVKGMMAALAGEPEWRGMLDALLDGLKEAASREGEASRVP